MSAKTFVFEIITPSRIAFSEEVESVQIPTVDGQICILPMHTPLFSKVAEGEVVIKKPKGEQFVSIGGGFIEVSKTKSTLLVTKALHADELSEQAILNAKKEAEEALKRKPVAYELASTKALLRSTLIDLKVVRRKRRPL